MVLPERECSYAVRILQSWLYRRVCLTIQTGIDRFTSTVGYSLVASRCGLEAGVGLQRLCSYRREMELEMKDEYVQRVVACSERLPRTGRRTASNACSKIKHSARAPGRGKKMTIHM
jgi:hypothetical protein